MTGFYGATARICERAFNLIVEPAIHSGAEEGILNKLAGHVVVLKPSIPYEPKYRLPDLKAAHNLNLFQELVLWERDYGDYSGEQIEKYTAIARAKAYTSFLTGLPSHLVQQQFPSLYAPGMTKWGGSAVAGPGPMRLIVAFSGVQWNFDQMISEFMISAIQALSHEGMRDVMASDEAMIIRPTDD